VVKGWSLVSVRDSDAEFRESVEVAGIEINFGIERNSWSWESVRISGIGWN